MSDKEQPSEQLTVFYDGDCALCTSIACERKAKQKTIVLRNLRTETLPQDIPLADAERELIVQDSTGKTYRNIDAVFKLFERHRWIRGIAKVASSSFLRPLFQAGYTWIAANRSFLIGPRAPLYWLKWIACLGFLASAALCWPLWIDVRSYPTVPLLSSLPPLPLVLNVGLLIVVISTFILAVFSSKPRWFLWTGLAIVGLLCVFDQSRWHPWVLDYSFLLAVLAVFSWKAKDTAGYERSLRAVYLILGGIYFFSGLQKAHSHFINETFPWFIEPLIHTAPFLKSSLIRLGVFVPLAEMAIGLAILTKRFRRVGLFSAALMHAFIFLLMGPFGRNWNVVVWPWTIAMLLINIILAIRPSTDTIWQLLKPTQYWLQRMLLLVFFILPPLSFVNVWDSYLSQALYSGNITEAVLIIPATQISSLPPATRPHLTQNGTTAELLFSDWSLSEVHTPPYPETRIFKAISKSLCQSMEHTNEVVLYIQERRLWNNSSQTRFSCEELLANER